MWIQDTEAAQREKEFLSLKRVCWSWVLFPLLVICPELCGCDRNKVDNTKVCEGRSGRVGAGSMKERKGPPRGMSRTIDAREVF